MTERRALVGGELELEVSKVISHAELCTTFNLSALQIDINIGEKPDPEKIRPPNPGIPLLPEAENNSGDKFRPTVSVFPCCTLT